MDTKLESFPSVPATDDDSAFNVLHMPSKRRRPIADPVADSPNHSLPVISSNDSSRKPKLRQGSYESLGLNSQLCAALKNAGYNFPTPIQRKSIPAILGGADTVVMARTGSGKTAAFLAPILHNLSVPLPASAARNNGPRALIVSPTRELAIQTLKFTRLYTRNDPIRTAVVVGGTPLTAQFESLAVCPPLVIATPGRLLQLLAEMGTGSRKSLTLSTTEMLVLDEADRMFEGTLAVETAALLSQLQDSTTEALTNRQTVLVSATMPHALAEFSRTRLRPNLSVIRLNVDKTLPPTLATAFLLSRADVEKDAALQCLLRRLATEKRSVVIFASTHRRVEYLTSLLRKVLSARVVCVHGNLDQVARVDAVSKFRKGAADLLIVTDVAARGLDLPLLDVVINYDVPPTPKLFVHRVGRVARAGRFGMALSIIAPDELPFVLDTFLFLGQAVTFAQESGDGNQNPFESQAYAIESGFQIGSLPKGTVDEEVEITRKALEDVDIDKLYSSAKNAQKLYTKTRGTASGESVRRAKELNETESGGRRTANVHPWFFDMESTVEREASHHASLLSVWRPKECSVSAPSSLTKRKRLRTKSDNTAGAEGGEDTLNEEHEEVAATLESLEKLKKRRAGASKRKISARQLAMDMERKEFFLPLKQDNKLLRTEKALKAGTGGSMGKGLGAYKELNDAAVDLNADNNSDLLRSKHVGGNSGKYWDRVSKKYVKAGATETTSKRNLHVASREAKARAKGGENYGTEDGTLFKRWLSKNRKNVEQMAANFESGEQQVGLSRLGGESGLGSNDFRKGAFGRKARIALAAKHKSNFETSESYHAKPKNELKTMDEITKARKLKAKAEARRKIHANKKKGKVNRKNQQQVSAAQRGASKSRLIIRRG